MGLMGAFQRQNADGDPAADFDQLPARDRDGVGHDLDRVADLAVERNHAPGRQGSDLLGSQVGVAGVDHDMEALGRRRDIRIRGAERFELFWSQQA